MYGIAGPYIKVTPYLELEANPLDDPWLTLSAGVDVPAGFSVVEGFKRLGNRFMLELEDFECISVQTKTVLLEQFKPNNPPYEASRPIPANGMTLHRIDPVISWVSGDPDGYLVSYDIYFEPGDSSPDILVGEYQADPFYGPGYLLPNTTYYWQINVRDIGGLESIGTVWSFTTGENLVINPGEALETLTRDDLLQNLDQLPQNEEIRLARRAKRMARYEEVINLFQEGMGIREIYRHLGVSRKTVRPYLDSDGFPEIACRPKRKRILDSYKPYLQSRWEDGNYKAMQLWQEIQAQGFTGAYQTMILYIRELRKPISPASKAKTQKNRNSFRVPIPTKKTIVRY
ncbi:MAG: hypothetical protein CL609_08895 [Anaerolineaceae bacterium]|nr:hypothetical protein [Anaerolineaceae bacterium]